jgi:hypothetical protein
MAIFAASPSERFVVCARVRVDVDAVGACMWMSSSLSVCLLVCVRACVYDVCACVRVWTFVCVFRSGC